MRHCDPDFGRLLNVMRKQQPPQELLDQDSSDYVISANDLSSILTRPTVTMLCALKQQVQTNHVDMLYAWFHTPAILNIPIYGSPINISECAKWVADDAFYTLPQVAVGARVTVTYRGANEHMTKALLALRVLDDVELVDEYAVPCISILSVLVHQLHDVQNPQHRQGFCHVLVSLPGAAFLEQFRMKRNAAQTKGTFEEIKAAMTAVQPTANKPREAKAPSWSSNQRILPRFTSMHCNVHRLSVFMLGGQVTRLPELHHKRNFRSCMKAAV
ncbi:MAG: hypothetical protein FRX49_11372 [Trebouxia sp. A1-2]|nr:MAG: hypothetical protein FRX49_11372 [Trebouxia sp. A1-2]